MATIFPDPSFFPPPVMENPLIPQIDIFEGKGVKRKSSAQPPPLVGKLPPRMRMQHDNDPFIKLIRSVHALVVPQEGLVKFLGEGYCMMAFLNLKTGIVRKFFKDPVLDLIKHQPFSGKILKDNMISELKRYHRLLTLNIRVATIYASTLQNPLAPVASGFYDQEYIQYSLPKGELPPAFVTDLTTLIRTSYEEALLIDISASNFGCREPDSNLTLFDFGISPSDEIEGRKFESLFPDEKQEALEDFRLDILNTLSNYLLTWDKLYPGSYMAITENFKESHPLIYEMFSAAYK